MRKLLLTFLFFIICSSAHATVWYACDGGGNWNGASVWTSIIGDQVGCTGATGTPVAGDTATLNATSGNITLTGASACAIIDMTGYAATLDMGAQTLTITGGVTLGGTIIGTVGTGVLNLTGSQTLTSNSITWPVKTTINNASTTITLVGNWISAGLFTNTSNNTVLNKTTSETFTCQSGFTNTSGSSGTATIILTGGTWSGPGIGQNPLTLQGNVTVSGTVLHGFGTLTYSSGVITVTGSTLQPSGAAFTFNTYGMVWNSILNTVGGTFPLTSPLYSNQLLWSSNGQVLFSGPYDIYCNTLTLLANQLGIPAGQTLHVATSIGFFQNQLGGATGIRSTTVSSPAYLSYTGTLANENIYGTTFADINASGPMIKGYGPVLVTMNPGTITRTLGLVTINGSSFNKKPINTYTGV